MRQDEEYMRDFLDKHREGALTEAEVERKNIKIFTEMHFDKQNKQEKYLDEESPDGVYEKAVELSGVPFTCKASVKNLKDNGSLIRFYLFNEKGMAYKGYIMIEKNEEDEYVADIGIAKIQRKNNDIKNKKIGRSLFCASLEYIAYYGKRIKKDIKTVLEWSEDYPYPNMGMKQDDWKKIFEPIVKNAGFEEKAGGEWERWYFWEDEKRAQV